jgi:zinc protease
MPSHRIDLALQLESDRMVNSLFEKREVEAERTVVISEREGHENEPLFRLSEEVQAAAFRVHSYHHEVIGDMADLRSMGREDLVAHYRRYYVTGNAVLTLAGDFRRRAMLNRIRQLFGPLPAGEMPVDRIRPEPVQVGERIVTVEGPGDTPYLEVAYRAPAAREVDFPAMAVLDSVLAGASSFNMFGPGISNKTSRLYRKLVEGGLAASVGGNLSATIDPHLYGIRATVRPDRQPEQVLAALDAEIDRLRQEPVSEEEVRKAIKQAKALFAYGSESITNQAFWLGFSEMFADYHWFETYLDRLSAVSPADVMAAGRKYLGKSNRVLGTYRPVNEGKRG